MSIEAALNSPLVAQRRADKLVYVSMAVLLIAVAAVGFAPRSMAILSGDLANPPLIVHVHAALMASWLLLFLAQTSLIATSRLKLHQTLGAVSFVLAPAIVVVMAALTAIRFEDRIEAGLVPNPTLIQTRAVILFAFFYTWALIARRTAPEAHKRLMLLASWVVIDASMGRMGWLPRSGDRHYDLIHVYQLLLLAPAVVYDLTRFGRVHRTYVIGIGLFLLFAIITHFLWDSPWWLSTATSLWARVS